MYMIAAGYDPQGAVRLQEKLAAAGGGGRTLPFLSTHPSSSERVEAMRTLVRQLAGDDPSQPK
jgi:predicted Zn-dependent protease